MIESHKSQSVSTLVTGFTHPVRFSRGVPTQKRIGEIMKGVRILDRIAMHEPETSAVVIRILKELDVEYRSLTFEPVQ